MWFSSPKLVIPVKAWEEHQKTSGTQENVKQRLEPNTSAANASISSIELNLQTDRRVLLIDVNSISNHTDPQTVLDCGTFRDSKTKGPQQGPQYWSRTKCRLVLRTPTVVLCSFPPQGKDSHNGSVLKVRTRDWGVPPGSFPQAPASHLIFLPAQHGHGERKGWKHGSGGSLASWFAYSVSN